MGGGDLNPYESGSAPQLLRPVSAKPRRRAILWIYANPLLIAMGIGLYVLLYYVGHVGREPSPSVRFWLLVPILLLLVVGMLALIVGWVIASVQLVVGLVRLLKDDPIWKHYLAAVVLTAVCYGVWILLLINGILLTA